MSKLLVKWNPCWADESDFPGFMVMDKGEYEEYMLEAKKYIEENGQLEWCFGTNESNEYDSFNRFEREFETKEISDEECAVLEKLLLGGFGSDLPDFEDYEDYEHWEDEDKDEDEE